MANTLWSELNGALGVDLSAFITELTTETPAIEELLEWDESGIETLSARVEFAGGALQLVPNAPRGGVADVLHTPADRFIEIDTCHLVQRDTIYADAALVRQAGRTTLSSAEQLRNDRLARMKRNLRYTNAQHRIGALMGKILDADGITEIVDLFAAFGLSQQVHGFDFASAGTNVVNETVAAQRLSKAALDGTQPPEGWYALCSPEFMDALRGSPAYERLAVYATPRQVLGAGAIEIDGTTYIEFSSPTGLPGIPEGEALLCPRGMKDLYITRYAPGDYTSAVGELGIPYYAKAEPLPMQKGFALESQSNPVNVVTRPRSVVRLIAE